MIDVPVTLNHRALVTVSAPWQTVFVAGAPGNQATPGTDYVPASGTVTITPNDPFETAEIIVKGDTQVEPDEYIVLQFGIPANATVGRILNLGFGTITNDDT